MFRAFFACTELLKKKCAYKSIIRGFSLFRVAFADEASAASAAFFGAANADSVLFAKVSVLVIAAIADVTVDFLIKLFVHLIYLRIAEPFRSALIVSPVGFFLCAAFFVFSVVADFALSRFAFRRSP